MYYRVITNEGGNINMKMKKVLAIGLSAAMIMSVTSGTVTADDLDADVAVEDFSDEVDVEESDESENLDIVEAESDEETTETEFQDEESERQDVVSEMDDADFGLFTAEEENTLSTGEISEDIIASGMYNDNITWSLYKDGTLVVEGSGDMVMPRVNHWPWRPTITPIPEGKYSYWWDHDNKEKDYRDMIKKIIVTEGITSIADFWGMENLTYVKLPTTVTKAENGENESAFDGDYRLVGITIPASVTSMAGFRWEQKVFRYEGTEEQWKKICSWERPDTTIYFNYVEKPEEEHEYYEHFLSIEKEATCEESGIKDTVCANCGDVKVEEIPALGHDWFLKDIMQDASCTGIGERIYYCKRCGKEKTEKTAALGHRFNDWKTISQATVFSPEKQSRSCSACGKSEQREVGSALQKTMRVSATSLPLKTKQKTNVLKVSGLAVGDSIASWKSNNTKVAKVSGRANGTSTITAGNKPGTAKITITLKSGLKKVVTVTVQKTAVKTKKITGVAKNLKLKRKQKAILRPVIAPVTSKQKITYKSSNSKVASVNSKGQITAKKKGTAVITVKSGSKTVKCKVTVK